MYNISLRLWYLDFSTGVHETATYYSDFVIPDMHFLTPHTLRIYGEVKTVPSMKKDICVCDLHSYVETTLGIAMKASYNTERYFVRIRKTDYYWFDIVDIQLSKQDFLIHTRKLKLSKFQNALL
jgi:hypothetical protein